MQGSKLIKILDAMDTSQYALIVGSAGGDVLTAAFAKRRVVHAGVRGKPIAPAEYQAVWQSVLKQKPQPKPRVVYIHIPFCRHRCLYCGFFQKYPGQDLETVYVDHLIKELQMSQGSSLLAGAPVNAVFIGGGTPSILTPHNVARLLTAIRECLPLANDYELTLEGRIHDLVPDKMEAWLANGVNRVSIGVQSFDTKVRRDVGRLDDTETVLSRLEQLTAYNQAVVIIDLIYGLPNQDGGVWANDIDLLKTAAIDGLDLYQLNIFKDSVLEQAIKAGKLAPAATTAEQALMFSQAEAELSDSGFSRLSSCHWGKTCRERSMYNTLTKSGSSVIPFGAGAGGMLSGMTMFLHQDLEKYLQSIEQGIKPIDFMSLQPAGSDLHSMVVGQVERGYISLHELAAHYGPQVLELKPLIAIWQERGLLQAGRTAARLTVAGQFWHTNLAQSVLECLHALRDGERLVEVQPIAAQG
ncbi:MAG: heme anaerobic degradation radical SAM methyltransferase ChuW/HutW [Sporomusa sp.]